MKQQTVPQYSQEPKQKKTGRGFITREMMKKEAEKIRKSYSQSHSSRRQEETMVKTAEEYEKEQVQKLPIVQGIDNIRTKVNSLLDQSGANTEGSKKDERVLLMASAVLQMCDLLTIYSVSMNKEMVRLNESASHNLNLQEMYVKTVESVTHQTVGDIYHNLKKQEKDAINELMQYVQINSDQLEKDITSCADKVKSAAEAAEKASMYINKSVKRFCTVRTIGDLLYYAAPVAVVIDMLLRLFDFI